MLTSPSKWQPKLEIAENQLFGWTTATSKLCWDGNAKGLFGVHRGRRQWFPRLREENVKMVDCPGVDESDVVSSFVLNYLLRAFCFMYVLWTSNAGGIQPDRSWKLLTCAQNLRTNANLDLTLFARCTLFVCNKWDLFEQEEREEMEKDTIEKLTRILGNLDPKLQIVYQSCKTAQLAETYRAVTWRFLLLNFKN